MSLFNRIANLFGAKQENETSENGLVLKKNVKVSDLKAQFNEKFGSVLRVYSGRSQVENDVTLSEAGLTTEGIFDCRGNMLVGNFTTKMMEDYGMKVKVYTCDEWVAVIDGLTLSASGIVKKNAVKADMEAMLTGDVVAPVGVTPVSEAKAGIFAVIKNSDGSYSVTIDGKYCANAKSAMRQIADALEFKYDAAWTTRQFGAKLSNYIEDCAAKVQVEASAQSANGEAVKATEAAKNTVEQAKIQAEKELVKVKAELEKTKAEAEAAQDAAKEGKTDTKASKSSSNDGALPGVFTLEDGRKICFSKGNLQFHCKNYEFRFAENQYDVIGEANKNIAPNYDGWIDLFGWGTSGYMGCQPTETSKKYSEYGPASGDIAGTKYDWGVYNPITNGGNKEGLWRTPTAEEMRYLLNNRPHADKLKISCKIFGKRGFILIPSIDFWEKRLCFPIDTTTTNEFDEEQWRTLEEMGCVFFCTCEIGRRFGDGRTMQSWEGGWYGVYSTASRNTTYRCYVYNADFEGSTYGKSGLRGLEIGNSVRLIKDIE